MLKQLWDYMFLVRTCIGAGCVGDSLKIEDCFTEFDCPSWSAWTVWNKCSSSCGDGSHTRSRTCSESNACAGENNEVAPCRLGPCPVWGEWLEPTECTKTCGFGFRLSFRDCNFGSTNECSEGDYVKKEKCNTFQCPTWSEWSRYGECSKSCGEGFITRSRPEVAVDGYDGTCSGSMNFEVKPCNEQPCPGKYFSVKSSNLCHQ